MGYAQDKAMVIHNDNGSISTIKISDIDTLKFTENFVEDIDGNVYKTVTIGTQTWMAENLRVTRYREGSAIPLVIDDDDWIGLTTGAYCFYDSSIIYEKKYGVLYNWYAVVNSNNIAPTGWHVPSEAEWEVLANYLGGAEIAGHKLKSTSGWLNDNNGTDEVGFCGLPGGFRASSAGDYYYITASALFWSTTETYNDYGVYRYLSHNNSQLDDGGGHKRNGYSVRLIKD